MPSARRLRVFSDLHCGDPRGLLREPRQFAPLLGDADGVVLNGDSVDTHIPELALHLDELRGLAAHGGRETTWLSGNHDPEISEHGELLLRDGRVWVTHGDVFFDAIAPWSRHAGELRQRIARAEREARQHDYRSVASRLRLHREIVRNLPDRDGLHGKNPAMRHLARLLVSPRRVGSILRVWATTPRVVAELARAQRPEARVVILGHTHFPGVWTVPGRRGEHAVTVINTGSFTLPFGGCFVELQDERLRVLRIRRAKNQTFQTGRVIAELGLNDA